MRSSNRNMTSVVTRVIRNTWVTPVTGVKRVTGVTRCPVVDLETRVTPVTPHLLAAPGRPVAPSGALRVWSRRGIFPNGAFRRGLRRGAGGLGSLNGRRRSNAAYAPPGYLRAPPQAACARFTTLANGPGAVDRRTRREGDHA
jgi:hypothetical protein